MADVEGTEDEVLLRAAATVYSAHRLVATSAPSPPHEPEEWLTRAAPDEAVGDAQADRVRAAWHVLDAALCLPDNY